MQTSKNTQSGNCLPDDNDIQKNSALPKQNQEEKCLGSFVTLKEWHSEQSSSLKNHNIDYELFSYKRWCDERGVAPRKAPKLYNFSELNINSTVQGSEDSNPNTNETTAKDVDSTTKNTQDFFYVEEKKGLRILLDVGVVIVCVIGSIVSAYNYYNAVNRSLEKVGEEPIATISFKHKSAQRKMDDRVLWDRLKQNTSLYDGDIIRTAEISEATITFQDGNVVDLYEQTLVQVFYDENGAAIDFSGGDIVLDTTNAKSGIALTSGETTVDIAANSTLNASAQTTYVDGKLSQDVGADIAINILAGEATLEKASSALENQRVLEKGSSLIVGTDNVVSASPISVHTPVLNAKYLRYLDEDYNVVFNYNVDSLYEHEIFFELSANRDFSTIEESMSIQDLEEFSFSLSDGAWYWRFYSDRNNPLKEGKFSLVSTHSSTAIVPSQDESYAYRTKNPTVRFMWTDDVYASEWVLEVANNEQMLNPVLVQSTMQPSSITSVLGEGTWYWKSTPIYPKTIITEDDFSSTVNTFKISRQGEIIPANLLNPKINDVVNVSQKTTGSYFSWERDVEAASYTILFSQNADLSNIVFEKEITSNYFNFTGNEVSLSEGEWFWSVKKTDMYDETSEIGEIRSFLALEGELIHETLEPSDSFITTEDQEETINFTWNTNIPLKTYFQVSADESFSDPIINTEVDSNAISNIDLEVGKWYWRIYSENAAKTITYTSEVKELIVDFSLTNPLQRLPQVNTMLVIEPSKSTSFTWDRVQNADYYAFSLYHASDRQNAVYKNHSVRNNQIFVDMTKMREGDYVWLVRAVAANTPSGQLIQTENVEQGFRMRKLQFINLESPSNNSIITGVSALVSPPTVRWTSEERVVSSEFLLSKVNQGLSSASRSQGIAPREEAVQLRIENPSRTVQLPPLEEGTWYWTVVAQTDNGVTITPAEPARFTVSAIEFLPAPALFDKEVVLDLEYLQANKYIDFSWQAVETADNYLFNLTDENGIVILQEELKGDTNYRFNQLQLLDRGTFYWSVKASRLLPNGETQGGHSAFAEVTVELPELITPKNLTAEQMYGL